MTAAAIQIATVPDPEAAYTAARERLVQVIHEQRLAAAKRRDLADRVQALSAELEQERRDGKVNHPMTVRRLERLQEEAAHADDEWRTTKDRVEQVQAEVVAAREARALPSVTVEMVREHQQRVQGTRRELVDVQAAIQKLTGTVSSGAGPRAAEVERLRRELEDARADHAVSNDLKDGGRVDKAAAALAAAEQAAGAEDQEAREARQALAGLERRAAWLKVLLHDLERGTSVMVTAHLRGLAVEVLERHDALAGQVRELAAELAGLQALASRVSGGTAPALVLRDRLASTVPSAEEVTAAVGVLRETLARAGIEVS